MAKSRKGQFLQCSKCNTKAILKNNSWCTICVKTYSKEYDKEYALLNKKEILRKKKLYYQKNKEKIVKLRRQFRKENKEKLTTVYKRYRKKYKSKRNALEAKRHASKLKATPKWLTREHFKQIEEFYILSKELQWLSNEPLHVDHIVPLQGKNICGLHVPWNLQILDRKTNSTKNNKF